MAVWREELDCERKNGRKTRAFEAKGSSLYHIHLCLTDIWHTMLTHSWPPLLNERHLSISPCVFVDTCVCEGGTCAYGGSQLSPVHWVHMEKNSRSDERSTWGPCLRYWVWPGMCVCYKPLHNSWLPQGRSVLVCYWMMYLPNWSVTQVKPLNKLSLLNNSGWQRRLGKKSL